jgi:hypothetical protein
MNLKKATILGSLALMTALSSVAQADRWDHDRNERERRRCDEYGCRGEVVRPGRPAPYPDPYPRRPDPYPGRPEPVRPTPPPQYGSPVYREIYVGRNLIDERLDVSAYLSTGDVVETVVVELRNVSNRSYLELLVDGRVEDTSTYAYGSVSLRPYSAVRVDRYGYRGQVSVRVIGAAYVDRIVVNGRGGNGGYNPAPSPGYPGYGVEEIRATPYRTYGSGERIDLESLMGLNRYSGYTIESIEVRASGQNRYNASTIDVMVNGSTQTTLSFNPNYTTTESASLYRILGRDIYDLDLRVWGSLTVESVIVRVRR